MAKATGARNAGPPRTAAPGRRSGGGLHRFANPGRFLRLADRLLPYVSVAAALAIGVGLYLGLFVAPPDYQQGESVRIMYVHVPSAWMAMFVYTMIAGASAASLIWKHPLADVFARTASPVGAGFTFLALVTGALWGKPMWGAYWVWDARLTSVLVRSSSISGISGCSTPSMRRGGGRRLPRCWRWSA